MGSGFWAIATSKKAIKKNEVFRTAQNITTAPVTVVGLRPTQTPSEKQDLDYNDRLAHDGAAVLKNIPAVNYVQKGGNYGSDPVLRGFKNEQLNTVINCAQCAIAACPNRMDPPTSQVAPNMIDKIEVLKGPIRTSLRRWPGWYNTLCAATSAFFREFGNVRSHFCRLRRQCQQ